MAAPDLDVQLVLYDTPKDVVWRAVRSVAAAASLAADRGRLGGTTLHIGDCGPTPSLSDNDVRALREAAEVDGVTALTWIYFDDNLGSAGGSNRLAAEGTAPLLLVLNPDTYVAPTLLAEMVAALADTTVGMADAKQLPIEHPKHYDSRRGDTSWASGSCMLVRRTVFESIGGFDTEYFFLYCDDVDISWRTRLAGHRVVHVPTALVFHDKRIASDGRVEPTDSEDYHGLLGRLMLAHRYDTTGILEETTAHVERAGTPGQITALADHRRRLAEGRVPARLPGAHRVAEFVAGNYSSHRF